jgi:hypothetical protein
VAHGEQCTQAKESLTEGVSKFAEATRHSITASRLAMAGLVALGAEGSAYFSDPERREAFKRSVSDMTDSLMAWWDKVAPTSEPGAGSTDYPVSRGTAADETANNVPPGAHSG